jgi:hypothetical protein
MVGQFFREGDIRCLDHVPLFSGADEAMPVEESGNMLIMTLSYTQASGDNFLINTYVCASHTGLHSVKLTMLIAVQPP